MWKPIWRWEVFLLAMVLVLAIAANAVVRADWPVVSPLLTIALLVVAVGLAVLLIVPLVTAKGRDSENTRKTLKGVELVPLEPVGEKRVSMRVEESERRQTSIDAAVATSRDTPVAVLTPRASRWLGRELRVAVDLVGDGGGIHRAGFVPRQFTVALDEPLRMLAAEGRAARVPVVVNGGGEARFTVDIQL